MSAQAITAFPASAIVRSSASSANKRDTTPDPKHAHDATTLSTHKLELPLPLSVAQQSPILNPPKPTTRVDDNGLSAEQLLKKFQSPEFAKEAASFGVAPEVILKSSSLLSKSLHSIPRARPLFTATARSEAEDIVDQMYAEANDEPFNLDASRLERSRLALEAAHDWSENHTPGEGWGPDTNGPRIAGPAPPTPYDALAPLPHPQVTATAAIPFMSQSPTAPSPNV